MSKPYHLKGFFVIVPLLLSAATASRAQKVSPPVMNTTGNSYAQSAITGATLTEDIYYYVLTTREDGKATIIKGSITPILN